MNSAITKIVFISLIFSGCVFSEQGIVKIGGTRFYTEKWYIDPANKDSRMLRGSTKDYGASAERMRDKYIVKYYNKRGDAIPTNNLWKIKCNGKIWRPNLTKEQYMENKKQIFDKNLKQCVFLNDDRSSEALKKKREENNILCLPNETREEYIKKAKELIKIDDWQDDPSQFYYIKNYNDNFVIENAIACEPWKKYEIFPIKQCSNDGWCEIYEDWNGKVFYVKKSALYK